VGRPDGSDYDFGEVHEIGTVYPSLLEVTDLDGNGRPDIIGLDWFTPALVYLQLEPGKFSDGSKVPDLSFSGFAPSTGFATLDVNGDGAFDLVVTRGNHHGLTTFSNDGTGHFPSGHALGDRSLSSPVVWDIDDDGDLDVAAVANDESYTSNSELALYINDGTALTLQRFVPFPLRGYGLQVANVTGDQRPELLLEDGGQSPRVNVFEQQDFASMVEVQKISASGATDSSGLWFQTGDLDGDGTADLVLVEDEREPDIERVWIAWSRNGVLTVAEPVATLPKDGGNVAGGAPRIADLNLDGRMDIALSSGAFDMVALLGQPDLTYRLISKVYPTAGSVIESAIAVGDINCDGCPDVVGVQVKTVRAFTGVGCARR
jgi:hypothetical protein